MKHLIVGGASINQTPLDWSGNLKNIYSAIREARGQGIELLCFPELAVTGYGCEDLFLSEWLPYKAMSYLPEIAGACEDITIAIGLPVIFEHKTYNCVCVISDRQILGITAKQYLPIDGVHYESRWFTPWKAHEVTEIDIQGQKVDFGDVIYTKSEVVFGFEICEDAWREDRPGKRLMDRKVDLILNPSASHFALGKTLTRQDLIIESSERFECVYMYVNLLGNEAGRMIYDGEIIIADHGKLLNKNSHLSFKPFNILKHEIRFGASEENSVGNFIEALSKKEEFTQAVSLGLYDYLRKSKMSGFVLSLSGGADSSTCAILVAEMVKRGINELGAEIFLSSIGKEALLDHFTSDPAESRKLVVGELLTTAYQATENSSKPTAEAASELAKSIGAGFMSWSIDDQIEGYTKIIEKALEKKLSWEADDISLQNIQARARSPVIWMLANQKNGILLTTSNRSEGDVGYATMDGDTSGSLAPIAAIDKAFIRDWLKWAQNELGYTYLDKVNRLEPSAELRPPDSSQTDENDLMPYSILVEIEKAAIRDRLSPVQSYLLLKDKIDIDQDLLKKYLQKFYTLWARNQWKRERTAPSFHLDDFNIDPKTWCRFPIVSGGFVEELEELKGV